MTIQPSSASATPHIRRGGCVAPDLAESPLADRVEWATFNLLSTAGRLDEATLLERVLPALPGRPGTG